MQVSYLRLVGYKLRGSKHSSPASHFPRPLSRLSPNISVKGTTILGDPKINLNYSLRADTVQRFRSTLRTRRTSFSIKIKQFSRGFLHRSCVNVRFSSFHISSSSFHLCPRFTDNPHSSAAFALPLSLMKINKTILVLIFDRRCGVQPQRTLRGVTTQALPSSRRHAIAPSPPTTTDPSCTQIIHPRSPAGQKFTR